MGRNTRLSPYAKGSGEEFDEDASVIEFMSIPLCAVGFEGKPCLPTIPFPCFSPIMTKNRPDGEFWTSSERGRRLATSPERACLAADHQGEYFGSRGGSNRCRDFRRGNPLALFCKRQSFAGRHSGGLSGAPNQVATVPAIQRVSPEPARAAPEPVVAIRSASVDPTAQEKSTEPGRSGCVTDRKKWADARRNRFRFQDRPPGPAGSRSAPCRCTCCYRSCCCCRSCRAVPSAAPPAARRSMPKNSRRC